MGPMGVGMRPWMPGCRAQLTDHLQGFVTKPLEKYEKTGVFLVFF